MALFAGSSKENLKENATFSIAGKSENSGLSLFEREKNKALCDVGNTVYQKNNVVFSSAKKQLKILEKTPLMKLKQKVPASEPPIVCNKVETKSRHLPKLSCDDYDDCPACEAGEDIDVFIPQTFTRADLERLALNPFPNRKPLLDDHIVAIDPPSLKLKDLDEDVNIWKLPIPTDIISPFLIKAFDFDVPPIYDYD